mmetsp:Transcript_10815/g.22209  ORF Transcript_10815/g.22209 Transcript_10815/m.22209 type:complete len:224 (-) Transcript_10815:1415-2086(-)
MAPSGNLIVFSPPSPSPTVISCVLTTMALLETTAFPPLSPPSSSPSASFPSSSPSSSPSPLCPFFRSLSRSSYMLCARSLLILVFPVLTLDLGATGSTLCLRRLRLPSIIAAFLLSLSLFLVKEGGFASLSRSTVLNCSNVRAAEGRSSNSLILLLTVTSQILNIFVTSAWLLANPCALLAMSSDAAHTPAGLLPATIQSLFILATILSAVRLTAFAFSPSSR